MKLFALLAGSVALAHAAEEAADAFQSASDTDVKIWKTDVLHAASTVKQIKNKSCQLPKGKTLQKLGDPTQVSKHFYKQTNGNTRSTYQFKFKDGTMVYAGNANAGAKGGNWKIYCYRQGKNMVTKSPHSQNDLSSDMVQKLRTIFKNIDKDGSGTITTGGAYTGLAQIFPGYSLPNFETTLEKESIKAAGKDKVVDLDEFECVAKKLFNIKKVYDEFRQYDKNHDLKMDRKELESALIAFYFKDVAKPGLIQTAAARANVKKTVDAIIARHDKNHDQSVSWNEFEMDAFVEEHYNLGAKCSTSKTPLNKHEVSVVENLLKKFVKHGTKKELSHSQWYQIVSLLTEQGIDKANGSAKPPALGCWHRKPSGSGGNNNNHNNPRGSGSGTRFGQNGGGHFGYTPKPGSGLLGGRVLLARFLQAKPMPQPNKPKMTVMDAMKALHKQADTNKDGRISDHEILDIFQGVRDHLSSSDFGQFLDMVNKIKGPVNCGVNKDCGKCTAVQYAGLCGWFAESHSNNPFGGAASTNKGNCKFVDRSNSAAERDNTDTAKATTCSTQCKGAKKQNPRQPRTNFRGVDGGKPQRV